MLDLIPPNVKLMIVGGAALLLIVIFGAGCFLSYKRGADDTKNAMTIQQLASANENLKKAGQNNAIAHSADVSHNAGVQVVHDTTHEIIRTVTLPAASDPFLPVGFVRLWDRAASRNIAADPYPGKSDGEPSDVRVSEAQSMLVTDWADKYYTCKRQVDDTRQLNPVLPTPPEERKDFFTRINPFN